MTSIDIHRRRLPYASLSLSFRSPSPRNNNYAGSKRVQPPETQCGRHHFWLRAFNFLRRQTTVIILSFRGPGKFAQTLLALLSRNQIIKIESAGIESPVRSLHLNKHHNVCTIRYAYWSMDSQTCLRISMEPTSLTSLAPLGRCMV